MSNFNNIQKSSQATVQTLDEKILVVKRSHLFPQGAWQGLQCVSFDHYMHIIEHKKEFYPRTLMEQDPVYKQIIPYLIFTYNGKFFLMQRHENASEKRLKSKLTLGIGGHIRQEDMIESSLFSWAMREFYEEVNYTGTLNITSFGIINDDLNDVGMVHIGFVFLLHGDNATISVKSELKSGVLLTLAECMAQRECMETWSQYVIDKLSEKT